MFLRLQEAVRDLYSPRLCLLPRQQNGDCLDETIADRRCRPTHSLLGGSSEPAASTDAQAEPAPAVQTAETRLTLADAIAHPRRAEDAARMCFAIRRIHWISSRCGPGQSVAEIWPGWYTPILAPYLADNDGTYVAVLYPDGVSERLDDRMAAFRGRYADAETFGTIQYESFLSDSGLSLADNSVDTILTFRNVHNWMGGGYAEKPSQNFTAR